MSPYSRSIALLILLCLYTRTANCNCANKAPSADCLFTNKLPTKKGYCYLKNCRHGNFMASVGNGFLGTVVLSDTINVAGVYNGKAFVKRGYGWPVDYKQHTHRARVPSSCAINFEVSTAGEHSYALDTNDGVFYHWFTGIQNEVTQRIYAHRKFRNLLVTEIHVRKQSSDPLVISLRNNYGNSSNDIDFTDVSKQGSNNLQANQRAYVGKTRETETVASPNVEVAVVHSNIPHNVTIPAHTHKISLFFITAISTSLETTDTLSAALKHWNLGWKMKSTLFQSHKEAWNKLWKTGNILVGGNLHIAQSVSAALYNILSSTRVGWPYGLSPGGLPGGEEYLGHTFWDQDIWMYPVLVALHSDLAKESLNYRFNRLAAARKIASQFGFRGAMFPWESALTGVEVCPGEIYGRNQIHITSDIAYAVRQYWRSTGDRQWMKDRGFDLVYDTAKFWASRVTWDADKKKYVINDVMPPDEHTYPANNSVYTNIGAKLNLEFSIKLGRILGRHTPSKWEEIREKIFIPFNKQEEYHPQHDGFNKSDIVKQADTILIGYPLMYDIDRVARENDLELYGRITTPNGPAMTHSMFTIGWLEIGETKKATAAFVKNFNNIHGPFKVWSEIRFGKGATNFITGAGGFLQSVINGYGGIRLKEDGLHLKGTLPENCTYVQLQGIKFHGNSISVNITKDEVMVQLVQKEENAKKLTLVTAGKAIPLRLQVSESLVNDEGVLKLPEQMPSSASTLSCVTSTLVLCFVGLKFILA